jgi:serine/threonine protein kinase
MVEVQRCERCGGDVSKEVLNGRRGQYMCAKCRDDVMADSGGLRRLLQDAPKRAPADQVPEIAGFEIGKILGRGGMGVVYQAVHRETGATVAIKLMLARIAVSPTDRMKFQREIDVGRTLIHPNIVTPMHCGASGSMFYFVMEYCNGGSLDGLIAQRGGPLPLAEAAPLMMQALSGLEFAHSQNFVHRDLKPQNVLLQCYKGRTVAKITDFGLAKNFEMAGLSGMTATGSFAGTLPFTPREQLTNYKYVEPASDVWSIAATFYHLLSGQYPLDFPPHRDPVEVILNDEAVPLVRRGAAVPAAVAKVLDRALVTDPRKRYATAGELRAALQKAI